MRNTVFTLILAFSLVQAIAQDGFIRGQVLEEATGEPLFGATIVKKGTTIGASTDFDGNFSLSLPVGTHDIIFQSVSFQSIVLEGVEVKENETTILDVVMKEDVQQLGEVVVTASVTKDSEIGVMLVQKKSVNTLDGISSSTFRKIGDSNLSSAMKRVTGVTIQGGKYVYVRGLGDRYTKTALNGMMIPGLDPDRNDVQIDIFPTGVLENVMVYKTFTPDLVGDFTGGLVNIQTKSFPDKKSTSFSVNMGYNPSMHFKSNYLSYKGSSTDFLGFDDGSRDLPVASGSIAKSNEVTNSFDPTLGPTETTSFMNTGFSFTHRNQIQGQKLTWGYNALLTYKNYQKLYEGFQRNEYQRDRTSDEIEIVRSYSSSGDWATKEVLWSGLLSIAAKSKNTTLGTNFLHIQNGVSSSLNRTINYSDLDNPNFLYNSILSYTERHLTNSMLFGKHQFNRFRIEWSNSLIFSGQSEPDYRDTRIADPDRDGNYDFSNGGQIERFWRELSELNESFKVDFTFDLNPKNKIKFGGLVSYRSRDFDLDEYEYPRDNTDQFITSSDPNDLLVAENIYSAENPDGFYIQSKTADANSYSGYQTVFAGYVMNEMQLTEKLKSVYGARLEKAEIEYSGVITADDGSSEIVDKQSTLDELNILPSINLIYALTDDINIRGSFNKTLARPSFKEKSGVWIEDPISDIIFIGNLDVKQAEILNYDVRGEYFFKPGEKVALSFFYKDFTDHIALVAFSNGPNQIKPRNVGEAKVYGTEFELVKRLGFISPVFENYSIGSNLSFVYSKVDRRTVPVDNDGTSEYDSEVSYKGSAEGVEKYRNMSYQAPYSVNAFISYQSSSGDFDANLSYNVQGETLTYISAAYVPEVYTQPFNSLNFKASKNFGANLNSSLSLRIQNILGDENELLYKWGADTEIFTYRAPGTTFTVTYSYSF